MISRNPSARNAWPTFTRVSADDPTTVVESRLKDRSRKVHTDPLGLSVIHDPLSPPKADIIFVHGLGGSSQTTWSRNRDPMLFWPREWLPLEPEIGEARILSFGYNANFSTVGQHNIFNIADFAKDLLFGMKFGVGEDGKELEVGKVGHLIRTWSNKVLF